MIGADARQLTEVSKALRQLKDKELNKALRKATNDAVEPAKKAYRAAALKNLPGRGGLADVIASGKFRLQRLAGKNPGFVLIVRRAKIHGGGQIDLKALNNRGILRHPIPNNRKVWVSQNVPRRWFQNAIDPLKPVIEAKLKEAVQKAADDIAARTRK